MILKSIADNGLAMILENYRHGFVRFGPVFPVMVITNGALPEWWRKSLTTANSLEFKV